MMTDMKTNQAISIGIDFADAWHTDVKDRKVRKVGVA
jgi:hypothetical protein